MNSFETAVLILLAANALLLLLVLFRTKAPEGLSDLKEKLEGVSARISEGFSGTQAGFGGLREEISGGNRLAREEIANRLEGISGSLTAAVGTIGKAQSDRLDSFATTLGETRSANDLQSKSLREELLANFEKLSSTICSRMGEQARVNTRFRSPTPVAIVWRLSKRMRSGSRSRSTSWASMTRFLTIKRSRPRARSTSSDWLGCNRGGLRNEGHEQEAG